MFSLHERPLTFCYQPAPGRQKNANICCRGQHGDLSGCNAAAIMKENSKGFNNCHESRDGVHGFQALVLCSFGRS